jgi:hypothetical protein
MLPSRIFIINPRGELRQAVRPASTAGTRDAGGSAAEGAGGASDGQPALPSSPPGTSLLSSLAAINDIVHDIFPPISGLPNPDLDLDPDLARAIGPHGIIAGLEQLQGVTDEPSLADVAAAAADVAANSSDLGDGDEYGDTEDDGSGDSGAGAAAPKDVQLLQPSAAAAARTVPVLVAVPAQSQGIDDIVEELMGDDGEGDDDAGCVPGDAAQQPVGTLAAPAVDTQQLTVDAVENEDVGGGSGPLHVHGLGGSAGGGLGGSGAAATDAHGGERDFLSTYNPYAN